MPIWRRYEAHVSWHTFTPLAQSVPTRAQVHREGAWSPHQCEDEVKKRRMQCHHWIVDEGCLPLFSAEEEILCNTKSTQTRSMSLSSRDVGTCGVHRNNLSRWCHSHAAEVTSAHFSRCLALKAHRPQFGQSTPRPGDARPAADRPFCPMPCLGCSV